MFEFTKLSNMIRIRFTVKISFKMPKQGRYTDKGSPPTIVYFPFFLCTILYKTNTSEISLLIAQIAWFFLICLNSSLNPIVDGRRYRKIRQIVKNTVTKIIRMNENIKLRIVLTRNVMRSFMKEN